MKNFHALLFVAAVLPLFAKAQSNFKPGYVVALNGDTIKGSVDYKEWNKTPKEIIFKANNSNITAKYEPAGVRAFGVTDNAYYRSFIVPVSKSEEQLSDLSHGVDTASAIENVFLKVITQGKNVTLYSYYDTKLILFIGAGNVQPEPLKRYLYINDDNNEVNADIYKQQLAQLAEKFQPANTRLKKDIAGAFYFLNDIKKLIISINGGDEEENISKSGGSALSGGRFFIGAGVNFSNIDLAFGPTAYSSDRFITKLTSLFPQINIGYDHILNKNVGQWILRAELSFTGSKVNETLDKRQTDDFIKTLKYDQYLITFSPQVICNLYNGNNFKVYIDGGATVNFNKMSNTTSHYILYNNYNKVEMANVDLPFPQTESMYFSFIGKAGVVINKCLEIYAGAVPNVYLIKNSTDLRVGSYKAGVNFLFGAK